MAKTNIKHQSAARTHEGGVSPIASPAKELRRTVMANMLFEDTFYESGVDAAARMASLIKEVSFAEAAQIAIDAREKFKLRHVPLFVVREMLRIHKGRQMGDLIWRVIQRPDEMGELLALYRKDGGKSEPAQLKRGLARAFKRFNEYQLGKYNRDGDFKLRDVLFMCHPRPKDAEQKALFDRVARNELATPDTWEVALSEGADKRATFERLMDEKKLGALALLRNLRNMIGANVQEDKIRDALTNMNVERVLPFRFLSAAKYAPRLEDALEQAMFKCLAAMPKLTGKTALLIDHSSSMVGPKVSAKSEVDRFDAACALGIMVREAAERCRVFCFSTTTIEVPPRRGFALVQAAKTCMQFGGTSLGQAVQFVYSKFPECDRLIVVTDEQSADRPQHPQGRGYIVNVGTYKQGIAYGPWISIDGWSEAILDYVRASEEAEAENNS